MQLQSPHPNPPLFSYISLFSTFSSLPPPVYLLLPCLSEHLIIPRTSFHARLPLISLPNALFPPSLPLAPSTFHPPLPNPSCVPESCSKTYQYFFHWLSSNASSGMGSISTRSDTCLRAQGGHPDEEGSCHLPQYPPGERP